MLNIFLIYGIICKNIQNILSTRSRSYDSFFVFTKLKWGSKLEFIQKKDIQYFTACEPLVEGMGFKLVDLNVFRKQNDWHIKVVIKGGKEGLGVKECATVHRVLQTRLEALIGSQDVAMEVSSPGINRVLKRSIELFAFKDEEVEIWDAAITEWRHGILKDISDKKIVLTVDGVDLEIPYENIKKARANL